MNSEKLKAYFQLSRPVNVIITFVSVPVACWIAGGTISSWLFILLAGMTGALVAAGANAINDAFDIDIDRINRPERPLPRGALTQYDARRMWLIVSITALGINLFLNPSAFLIVVLSIALLYFYSARLKRTVLVGNLIIGLMTGMAFIYGGAMVGRMERAVIPAIFAFLVNLARELLKDVEDMEGDRREHAVTLPIKYGVIPALVLATASLLVLMSATIAVAILALYQPAFLYIVLIADCMMCVSIILMWRDYSSTAMRRVSTFLKISMIIGLISIIAGSM
ncbi:MAG: geranylgeranylglycerol-phosphate geranylgeranyltransferase [Bacteroidota bacterium]|jgi:geranylgeranylglycerol-phosphate geranylgeranyltransferase